MTRENSPNSAGVVLRIAISDHCLCVSNPRCLRISKKYLQFPAHHKPAEYLLRIGLKVGTQEGFGFELSPWVTHQHPAYRHSEPASGVPHGCLGSDYVQALRLYESVLDRHPRDEYALRGVARTLANLVRMEEATDAYEKAAGRGRKNTTAVIIALEKMRDEQSRKEEKDRARHVALALERLRGFEGSTR